ncbi:MAG: asparagine synthase (glutamine-hydrolyzing) [Bacteroidota bacterium]
MCGIAGIIHSEASEFEMQDALKNLYHRGPDSSGVYTELPLILGHTRLAIQDLSEKASQPMLSADDRYVITYNGEIYNHQNIRTELSNLGVQFTSNSDTETLLYAYIHFGENVLERLNGIFSFAIFDRQERVLFAARDAYGVKPFYYYLDKTQFIFSSEIKSILSLGKTKNSINTDALFQTLMLQWAMDENTGFSSIKKLLPGHSLSIHIDKLDQFNIKKWHKEVFSRKEQHMSEELWISRLDEALTAAVQRQLLSDVPIAFFLSGGLDSSLLLAIAKKTAPEKVGLAFCLDAGKEFIDEGFSEDMAYAKMVAEHLNIELKIIEAQSNFLEDFDQMIFHLEEVQADIAPLFVQQISRAAKNKGYKVLIGGVGGDDLFSGYRRHQAVANEKWISFIPLFIRKFVKNTFKQIPANNKTRRLLKLTENLDQSSYKRMFSYFFWASKHDVIHLFSKEIQQQINPDQIEQYFEKYLHEIPEKKNILNQLLYLEMRSFLPCHNLNYTDKMGMAESVEIRVPYLDNELVKLAASIPPELKLKGITTKYLLKKVAEKYLPKEVIYRSKTGFGAPIRSWMQNDEAFQQQVRTRLFNPEFIKNEIFDHKAIEQIFEETISKRKDYSYTLLALLAIESWMRQFATTN